MHSAVTESPDLGGLRARPNRRVRGQSRLTLHRDAGSKTQNVKKPIAQMAYSPQQKNYKKNRE